MQFPSGKRIRKDPLHLSSDYRAWPVTQIPWDVPCTIYCNLCLDQPPLYHISSLQLRVQMEMHKGNLRNRSKKLKILGQHFTWVASFEHCKLPNTLLERMLIKSTENKCTNKSPNNVTRAASNTK